MTVGVRIPVVGRQAQPSSGKFWGSLTRLGLPSRTAATNSRRAASEHRVGLQWVVYGRTICHHERRHCERPKPFAHQ